MEHIACPETGRNRREALPNRRESDLFDFEHGNAKFTATVSRFADGRLAEIFLDNDKPNSTLAEHASDSAVLAPLLLQHGVSPAAIRHSISGPLGTALDIARAST